MAGWACVCRLGGIGDNFLAASTLRPLKKLGYKVEVITSDHCHVVFLNNPYIDKLTVKSDADTPKEGWNKYFITRSKEYEIFANLSHTCEYRHALFVDQTAFWWRPEYRRKLCAGSYLETVHDVVGVAHDFGPLFFPTEEEKNRALKTRDEQIGGRYIAWALSGSRVDKIYPYSGMAIARIIKELDIPVMMVGVGGPQFEMARSIQGHVRRQNGTDKGLHLALSPDKADPGGDQSWPIRRSLTQVLASDLVITPDTGVAWAAAMEPMPKIVMLSHASVENIVKNWVNTIGLHADQNEIPCWPCHRLHNDISTCVPTKDLGQTAACISDISVELLMMAISASLGSKRSLDRMLAEWPARVHLENFSVLFGKE